MKHRSVSQAGPIPVGKQRLHRKRVLPRRSAMAAGSVDSEMESRDIEPRKMEIPEGLQLAGAGGDPGGPPVRREVRRPGRGRRAGQTIIWETMEHGRSAILRGRKTGAGRDRSPTSANPPCPMAAGAFNENRAIIPGRRGEPRASQRRRDCGSLSRLIVPIENRRTCKRREPGSREGGGPRTGTDAGIHALPR